ncbi:hypothetical protein JTB14_037202 [Gonioctena quinquepunctata]|nr:hypothetical protein JTB14_037202 [Gonioctena quinquepunctata]
MFKNAKVTYPKRKDILQDCKVEGMPESSKETIYDTVLLNFQLANRKTYIHRIIYVGEHKFPWEEELMVESFRHTIDRVNENYVLEKLTGFLLCYRFYFAHMVEGDEDAINAHLGMLLNNKSLKPYFGDMKLLIHVSHINRRFMIDWNFYKGMPSRLLGDIDPNSSLEDTGRHIYNCIKRIHNLVATFVEDNYVPEASVHDDWEMSYC